MVAFVLLCVFAFYSCNADCSSNYDLKSIEGQFDTYLWDEHQQTNAVDFSICKTGATPCGTGVCGKPNCCGSCQRWVDDSGPTGVCLGIYKETVLWKDDKEATHVALHYTGGDPVPQPPGPRELYINLTCSTSATKLTPKQFVQPTPDNHPPNAPYIYSIVIETNAVCGSGTGGGVYGGGVFLILLFVGFFVYFAAGVAYNFSQHKEGRELVPHIEFWSDSPTLFIEGCHITWRKITGICGRNEYDPVS